jgi:hypothetical protein
MTLDELNLLEHQLLRRPTRRVRDNVMSLIEYVRPSSWASSSFVFFTMSFLFLAHSVYHQNVILWAEAALGDCADGYTTCILDSYSSTQTTGMSNT